MNLIVLYYPYGHRVLGNMWDAGNKVRVHNLGAVDIKEVKTQIVECLKGNLGIH